MTRVIQSWDIRSTSDIRSNWGYRRTGSDMNELCSMPILSFFILAHPWAWVDLYGKQLNKYVMCTEKNDSKRNISTIVIIPLFWRYKNNEYIQS